MDGAICEAVVWELSEDTAKQRRGLLKTIINYALSRQVDPCGNGHVTYLLDNRCTEVQNIQSNAISRNIRLRFASCFTVKFLYCSRTVQRRHSLVMD